VGSSTPIRTSRLRAARSASTSASTSAPDGQRWTTLGELRAERRAEIRDDGGLLGIGCEPSFAIGQRALLVDSVLWNCTPLLDGMEEVVAERGCFLAGGAA